ncbi:MAG: hypothetical protein F6J93_39370 [Oscillatoria sp. SIO1A7]|nr:hypothetical protein [Oscillatoria sp. SIO1A7]
MGGGEGVCPMPNAQCPMPNAQCPMPNAPFPIPNSQFYYALRKRKTSGD